MLIQAFKLSECDSASKSQKKEIEGLRNVIKGDNLLIDNLDDQLTLSSQRLMAKDADMAFTQGLLKVKEKKIRRLKFGLFSIGLVGVVSNGYLLYRILR